jgi:flagellar motility protein MotE (MotC chaperone)
MTGKLRILIFVGIAGVSFAASYFASSWLGGPQAPVAPPEGQQADGQASEFTEMAISKTAQAVTARMKEAELVELIRELRLKTDSCRKRQRDLDERDERIALAIGDLRKQAEQIEALRMKLVNSLTHMRQVKTDLENSILWIQAAEEKNLKEIAGTCEGMDTTKCAEMFTRMCESGQKDDVVKILYYMQARQRGKVLSELAADLSATLCASTKHTIRQPQDSAG